MVAMKPVEAGLILKKYVDERTAITALYQQLGVAVKLRGRVDSLTESGLVIKSDGGDILEIDVRDTSYFALGDDRDLPEGLNEVKGKYDSCLSLSWPSGARVSLFELVTR